MSKSVKRAAHGPSWAEVILGAFLSLFLGVVLGAALLILRPVVVAREEPKERDKDLVYYIEGSRDASKARQALAKRKAFSDGQSVSVNEEEINALIAPVGAAGAGAEKGKEAAAAAPTSGYLIPGTPNIRVRDGTIQIGVPVTIDLLSYKITAQTRGGLVKEGDIFVYRPDEIYLGSCPLARVPFLGGMVRDQFLHTQTIPEDIKASWLKLKSATIEGNIVRLTMP